MNKYSKMVDLNKKVSREKIDRAIESIIELLQKEEQVTVGSLVKKTGLSRGFFYKNEEVRNRLQDAMMQQEGKVFVKNQKVILNKAMEKQLAIYERQIEKLKEENRELKAEKVKLEKALQKRAVNFINGL